METDEGQLRACIQTFEKQVEEWILLGLHRKWVAIRFTQQDYPLIAETEDAIWRQIESQNVPLDEVYLVRQILRKDEQKILEI